MTPREAVALATVVQAYFPSQPISEFTPDALHELLEPYTLADCKAAVQARALRLTNTEGQKWCAPTDVYAEVRRARAKAIANDEALELPPHDPDDTGLHIRLLSEARAAAIEKAAGYEPQGLVRGSIAALGGPVRRINELEPEVIAPHMSLARQALKAAQIEAQANEPPEPEPLVRPEDRLREPEPT